MVLLLRIETTNGQTVNRNSELIEMLNVMADVEMKVVDLTPEEDETLRGWVLLKAEALNPGEGIINHRGTHVSAGKNAEGRGFVKDKRGEWPPPRPNLGSDLFGA